MSDLYRNFVGGEWLAGASVTRNVNPSNTDDVIGEYATGGCGAGPRRDSGGSGRLHRPGHARRRRSGTMR